MSRNDPRAKAEKIRLFWQSEMVRDAYDAICLESISAIERIKMDGSEASNAEVLELVRKHQTLVAMRRASLSMTVGDEINQRKQRPLRA